MELESIWRLRGAYIVALGTVACLSLGAQNGVGVRMQELSEDAALINDAGRQRMLSQRTASRGALLGAALQRGDTAGIRTQSAGLEATLGQWEMTFAQLAARDSTAALRELRTEHLAALAVGRRLLGTAGTTTRPSQAVALADSITVHTDRFLLRMDPVVTSYQAMAEERLSRLRRYHLWLTLTVLAVLLASAVLIFEPVIRRLRSRQRQLQASADANRRLATIAQRTTNAVVTTDAMRRITWVNEGFTRVTGYTLEEVIGKSPGQLLQGQNTDPAVVAQIRAALAARQGIRCELINQAKDGREYWLDVDIQPEFAEDGALLGFIAIESDITEQVRTREKLQSVFSAVAEGIVQQDGSGMIIGCNQAAERILGLTADQMTGRTSKDPRWRAIREDGSDFPGEEHPASVTLRTGESIRNVIMGIRLPDDTTRWLSVSSEPVQDADGRVLSVVTSFADVTATREQTQRLDMMVRSAGVGIWDWDALRDDVVYNARWAEITGHELSEIGPGKLLWQQIVHPEDRDSVKAALLDHYAGRTPEYRSEHRLLHKDGSIVWVLDVGRVTERDAAGGPLRAVGMHIDITRSKLLKQELRTLSDRYQAAVYGTNNGLWDWDLSTDSFWCSERFWSLLDVPEGGPYPEPHMESVRSRLHPDDREMVSEARRRHEELGEPFDVECRMRTESGAFRWFRVRAKSLLTLDGTPIRMAGSIEDISERRETQARLAARERTLTEITTAMDAANDCVFMFEADTLRYVYANRGALRQVGLAFEEMRSLTPLAVMPGISEEGLRQALAPLIQQPGSSLTLRTEHAHRDGTCFPVDISLQLIPELGAAGRFIANVRDITDQLAAQHVNETARQTAEAALREVNALRTALDEHALISVTDRDGAIIDVNTGLCRLSGYAREELLGQNHRILNSGVHPRAFWTEVWQTITSGRPWRGEVCNRSRQGALYWVNCTIVPFMGADGGIEKYVSLRFDITARKEAEVRLVRAESQAQAASAAKSEFLANMSHEIRTPMTAILGYAELLGGDGSTVDSPAVRAEYVNTIKRNGEHLLSIINDILDLSKIEAGKMSTECIATSPAQLMHEVESLMSVRAAAKGITLSTYADTALPATIHTDPVRLKQILVNLVGNAIKFTELGGVQVRASLGADAEGTPHLRIAVVDSGIGLEPSQLDKLFQAFSQADDSTTRKYGGTGLGLRICKSLAALLGGDITVTSDAGVGSTFVVTLSTGALDSVPLLSPDALLDVVTRGTHTEALRLETDVEHRPLAGHRIFLAEDGPDNQRLISHHLRKAGATVEVFDNGLLLLQAMTRDGTAGGPLHQIPRCDVVLTDMQMPVMDGYTLAQTLRTKGWSQCIVAITAHVMSGDADKCREAGCDRVGGKPINRQELIDLCTVEGAPRTAPEAGPTITPADVITSLDAEELRSEWEAFEDLADLVSGFAAGLADKADDLERMLAAQSQAELLVALHQLKGAAGGYGFPTITDAAHDAELLTKIGENWGHIDHAVRQLVQLCRRAARSAATR